MQNQAEKLTMSKNEYQEYCKINASKIWNKDLNYTQKDYFADCDNVNVLPFDLSMYNLSDNMQKWINIYFDEETTDRNGYRMLKGSCRDSGELHTLRNQLELSYSQGSYYSNFMYNNNARMILTYCEGDLHLKIYTNDEEYQKRLAETITWYEENT